MGVDYIVEGIAPPDETWKKMKAIWDACIDAGVQPPREVDDFFEDEPPDPDGVVKFHKYWNSSPTEIIWPQWIEAFADKGRCGVNVDVRKLPKHIKIIRFGLLY